jgi:hypothetical protein
VVKTAIPLRLLIPILLIFGCVLGVAVREGIRGTLDLEIDPGLSPPKRELTFWDEFLVLFVFGVSIATLIILTKFPPQLEEVGEEVKK